MTENELLLCPNCGASFDAHLDRCPHCLYINPEGAEEKFMDGLEQTRADLDQVDDQAREAFKEEVKGRSKSLLRTLIIVAVVVALLVGLMIYMENRPGSNEDYAAELVWQQEHFPELDDLYSKGRYDEIATLIYEYSDEGHYVWEWEHYDEIMDYEEERWEDQE